MTRKDKQLLTANDGQDAIAMAFDAPNQMLFTVTLDYVVLLP